jgi:hypothetical protein
VTAPCKETGDTDPANQAIFELNARQRDRGIVPQCDLNGTFCGALK